MRVPAIRGWIRKIICFDAIAVLAGRIASLVPISSILRRPSASWKCFSSIVSMHGDHDIDLQRLWRAAHAASGFASTTTLRHSLETIIIAGPAGYCRAEQTMELNQVRYFLTLADTLNFTRAAEACNVTQPALTRAIQKLEEEFGGLLFHRERNLTQLTELGRLMRPRLEQASVAAQSAREEALAFKRRETSPLRVGLDHSISASVLTPVLRELALHSKGLELVMWHASSAEVCRGLLDDSIDVALIVEPDKLLERLNRWPLYEERLVLLFPPEHRFAALDEVPLSELGAERILRRAMPSCAIAADLEPRCAAAGIALNFYHSGSREDDLHEMVKAALGVAVAAERQPVPAGVLTRNLAGVPPRTVVLTAISGRRQGASISAFLKLVRARDWSVA